METTPTTVPATDRLDQSFDLVARQDQADANIAALRGDVDEVKARLDKVARAASRPAMGGVDRPRKRPPGADRRWLALYRAARRDADL